MRITTTKFIKGLVGDDPILGDGKPQIAFIGRSNVGKSSLINSLTNNSSLAKTSSFPGRTQQINIFLINGKTYFVDLPGYGFARVSAGGREKIGELIDSYLFGSDYPQKVVVLIIDANVGPTDYDMAMLDELEQNGKNILVIANKVDKIKKSDYKKQMAKIENEFTGHKVIPYSSKARIGIKETLQEILK